MEILCLHIFVYILSSRCINFMVYNRNWLMNLPYLISSQVLSTWSWVIIYIYLYLLTYYLPAFSVTRKKRKNTHTRYLEITISRITAWRKKKKSFGKKIKKRPTSSHQLKKKKKKKRDMQFIGKKNKNRL